MIRRDWLKKTTILAGALSLPAVSMANKRSSLDWSGKKILFQGDSITDGGRDKENQVPNNPWSLGQGYVFHTGGALLRNYIASGLEIHNRGISGNKVFQLAERWHQDCLDLQPDMLSILIGVNDFWHTLSGNYEGTVDTYENDFRELISKTLKALPNIAIIIGEPFIVKGGSAITAEWYPAFSEYQKVAFNLAKEFNAGFIPYQRYFDEALEEAPASYWCPDGVHPSIAGSVLMAEAWIETFKRM